MNFSESTQHRNWNFSADQLKLVREENRQRSLDALSQAQRARSASAASLPTAASLDSLDSESTAVGTTPAALVLFAGAEPLSLGEERELLKYYGSRLQHICRELRLSRGVLGTALTYLKRIYLAACCVEQDPQQLLLTCLYLACKIEEHYISAAELGRLTGAPAEVILRTELMALQGLRFDLIVYSPYKAIDGFLEDIKEAAAAVGGSDAATAAGTEVEAGLDAGMAGLPEEQLAMARQAAYNAADSLMLSDAPLLHTPGRLALAAVRSAFNKLGIKLQRYLERVAKCSSGEGGGDWQQHLQQLQAALSELDHLGTEAVRLVDQAQLVALNRRLKACRGLLQDGSGQRCAKATVRVDKQSRKAANAAEQRDAAEAALGIQPIQAAVVAARADGAEQPPAKRLRQGQ